MTQGRKVGARMNNRGSHYKPRLSKSLMYGNGCRLFDDCLSCPLPDCVWDISMNAKKQEEVIKLWKPCVERELSKVATVGGKG